MKKIVDILLKNELIYRKLHKIDNKLLGTRKKVEIYEGVDLKSYYAGIFYFEQKSRFLRKNVTDLETLLEKLKVLQDHNIKKKILIYDMPLCSKAETMLKELKWKLIDASV
jgi:hypothetical protein